MMKMNLENPNFSAVLKKLKPFLVIVLLVVLCGVPFVTSSMFTRLLTTTFIYCIVVFGNMLIFGFTGMLCVGFAAFWGTGAYIAAIFALKLGLPFDVCLLLAGLGTSLFGALICLPILRLSVDFVGLITTAWLNIFIAIVKNWNSVTNGAIGLVNVPRPTLFWFFEPLKFTVNSKYGFYFMMLIFVVVAYVVANNILHSKIGRNMMGIRDNDIGAVAVGVKSKQLKVFVFAFGTFFAGVAGALYTYYIGAIAPNNFTFQISSQLMQMCIIGGIGTLPGAVVGATFMTLIAEVWRPLALYRFGVAGLFMVILMVFRPQGLVGSRAYAGDKGILDRLQQMVKLHGKKKKTADKTVDT